MVVLDEAAELFSEVVSPRERLQVLIELGEGLPRPSWPLSSECKVPGCTSNAYMRVWVEGGRIRVEAWADSLILRGYLYLLVGVFDGIAFGEFSEKEDGFVAFIEQVGLERSLVPSRANALQNLLSFLRRSVE